MISGESFVYFGPEEWNSMWRNRHQLLSRLARANRVVYVEPRPYTYEVTGGLRRGELHLNNLRSSGVQPVAENLWLYRWPRFAPVGGPPPLRAVTHWLRRNHLRRALAQLDIQNPIVWLSNPSQADARFDVPARLRVYHIVDEYLAYYGLSDTQRVSWATRENTLIAWADLVVVVSAELMETKGPDDPKFRLLPNAVDADAYQARPLHPVPPALADLPRPILGYIGLISTRLDLALLNTLAAQHPDWTLVMIGTVYRDGCEEALNRLEAHPNVHLLPRVPAQDVPDYVRRFDLGLVPYKITLETYHASPLKIYEYLAAGLPVVSADVPGARQFAQVITIATTPAQWAAAIAEQLAANTSQAAAARRQAVAAHTWDARVETLSGYLIEALGQVSHTRSHHAPTAHHSG